MKSSTESSLAQKEKAFMFSYIIAFIQWHVIDLFIEFLFISSQKNGDIPVVYLADLDKEFMSFSNNDLSHFFAWIP